MNITSKFGWPDVKEEQLLNLINIGAEIPEKGADLVTVILKGHLVIEEIVRTLINENTKDSKSIQKARLSFYQAIYVSKALLAEEGDLWIWDAALKLNVIRNKIAHNLEVVDIDDKLGDFVEFMIKGHVGSDIKNEDLIEQVRLSVVILLGLFFQLSKPKSKNHPIK